MAKKISSASKISLASFDNLMEDAEKNDNLPTSVQNVQKSGENQIQMIPIEELHEFAGHPFKVVDDEKMEETRESIRTNGVLVPIIVRKRALGGYEIIAGHRRTHASKMEGLTEIPAIVKDYSDDEATIIMVDSNIQRETLMHSEKAHAYEMRYKATMHQGKSGGLTLEEMGEAAGVSWKTIQRYIWLARLSEDLLDMVDSKVIGFTQGVDLSFLNNEMQEWVYTMIHALEVKISTKQSEQIKKAAEDGTLTLKMVEEILTDKKIPVRKFVLKEQVLMKYFTPAYTDEEIEKIIVGLLEQWKEGE